MRKYIPYIFFVLACLLMVLFSGCATRKTETTKERSKLFERNKTERTAPGSQIVYFPPTIAYPMPENPYTRKRPKNKIVTPIKKDTVIKGPNGATATVSYHPDGHIRGFVMDCPPVSEKTETERLEEKKLKHRLTEREFDLKIAKEIKSTTIWIAGIFAAAWVVRGVLK